MAIIIIDAAYQGGDSVNAVYPNKILTNQASYLWAGRGDDDTAYARGLPHITPSNDNRLFMGSGDDTLYLCGDLYALDDTYNVDAGADQGALHFQFVDTAQEAEFIALFSAGGGTYDAGTNTFGNATGLMWYIDQADGAGQIQFTSWKPATPSPLCFAAGTMISTTIGDAPVEKLAAGDMVHTMDYGFQEVLWIGKSTWSEAELADKPNMHLIRIKAGVLGAGFPKQDVIVSCQHRILIDSTIAYRVFGNSKILIPAKDLICLDGVDVFEPAEGVQYYHLMCAEHESVYTEGAPSDQREQVENMLARHRPNNRALLSDAV